MNTARKLGLSLTAFTLMGLVTSQPTGAQSVTQYSITDLGTGAAYGINNKGQVVGRDGTGSDISFNDKGLVVRGSNGHAFLYSDGVRQDLGTLGGSSSTAYGINDNGQVVGQSDISSQSSHAFLWDADNGMQDLGTLDSYNGPGTFKGYDSSYASSINNQGQIVGASVATVIIVDTRSSDPVEQTFRVDRATLWNNGTINYLDSASERDELSGNSSFAFPFRSTATAINNAGQVAGASGSVYDSTKNTAAVVWENGLKINLYTGKSLANSINEKGQVVGTYVSSIGGVTGPYVKGFLSSLDSNTGKSTSFTSIDLFGQTGYRAQSINNKGQVVGNFAMIGNPAFIWENGVGTNLNRLIPDSSGWRLQKAWAINDAGQIVGEGQFNSQTHAFLLTPVPEAASTP